LITLSRGTGDKVTVGHLWESLLANLAILALLVLVWAHFQHAVSRWTQRSQRLGFGLLMGAGAVFVMQFTIELRPGLYFDLRTVAIALAGVFAGPVGVVVALLVASAQRILIGGDGVAAGIVTMAVVGAFSVAGFYLRRGRPVSLRYVIIFGVVTTALSTAGVAYATLQLHPDQMIAVGAALGSLAFASFVFNGTILVQDARQRQLREEFTKNQAVFGFALTEMSDGIVMFDKDKRVVFSNEQYLAFFPRTRDLRVRGTHLRDILRGVVDRGEQLGRPESDSEAWIEETIALLNTVSEEEVQLFDGRWLSLRTRPAADGSCMVVVSDLTRHKKDQRALREMTERLQLLASTDGLTGIGNRRAFDLALAREVDIAARTMQPLSLLLVDIDWFKSFNDEYGHLVGDRCLRAIAATLRAVANDPADLVARFGGEEFVALLPGMDVDAAIKLSEAFSNTLHARAIEHTGSPKGIVTASVGVASWAPQNGLRALSDLVRDADIALYRAKSSGRDQICTKDRAPTVIAGAA
jgi:diguanylate cyclase (GGDEF)-like protein